MVIKAVTRGAARCASQVLDRGAQAVARGATHVLDRGAQAVARCAPRCALHVHGRRAKTEAGGRSFVYFSTQDSAVGLRLWLVVPRLCLRHNRLACGIILEVNRNAVAAGEGQLFSCAAEQSKYCLICTVFS